MINRRLHHDCYVNMLNRCLHVYFRRVTWNLLGWMMLRDILRQSCNVDGTGSSIVVGKVKEAWFFNNTTFYYYHNTFGGTTTTTGFNSGAATHCTHSYYCRHIPETTRTIRVWEFFPLNAHYYVIMSSVFYCIHLF